MSSWRQQALVAIELRRRLSTIGDDVDAVLEACDAVDISQAERELLSVRYRNRPLYFQGTLSLIKDFAIEEAPPLIDTAGRDGVIAMRRTLRELHGAAEQFLPPVKSFPTVYSSVRVSTEVESLVKNLGKAARLADESRPRTAIQRVEPHPAGVPGTRLVRVDPRKTSGAVAVVDTDRDADLELILRQPSTDKSADGRRRDDDEHGNQVYAFALRPFRIPKRGDTFELMEGEELIATVRIWP